MAEKPNLTDAAERERLLEIINGPLDMAGSGRYPRRDAMMGALPAALALIGELLTKNERLENLLAETGCFENYSDRRGYDPFANDGN